MILLMWDFISSSKNKTLFVRVLYAKAMTNILLKKLNSKKNKTEISGSRFCHLFTKTLFQT